MGTISGLEVPRGDKHELDGAAILKQREHATGGITEKDLIDFNLHVNVDKILFYFLAAACKGEAFHIVRNVPGGLGAEAWRRLCRRFGAKTRGKKVVLLRRCVTPPKVKQLGEAPGLMEEGDTYQDPKEAIIRYVQVKADLGGPVPMDCSSLEIQDTTSGHSRDVQDMTCMVFWTDEMKIRAMILEILGDHRLVECPTKDHDVNKGKGKGQWTQWDVKGEGKSGGFNTKGFGKGKTGKSNPAAHTRGQHHQRWSGPSSWKGGKGPVYLAEHDWNTDYSSSTPMFHVDVVDETRDSNDGTSKHHEARTMRRCHRHHRHLAKSSSPLNVTFKPEANFLAQRTSSHSATGFPR